MDALYGMALEGWWLLCMRIDGEGMGWDGWAVGVGYRLYIGCER